MGDITLSSAVRQNLLSLQDTAALLGRTQNRLATGLKVNSALDNPKSFFTAAGLNDRASDLNNLLDDMGQAVQNLKAADEGIKGITRLVESAKAKATQALQANETADRRQYAQEFNDLMIQIEDLAKDSIYNGKNLLGGTGNDLRVIFNEDNTSSLTIEATDYTDTTLATGLAISDLTVGESASDVTITSGAAAGTDLLTDDSNYAAGDTITITTTSGANTIETKSLTVTATTTVQDVADFVNGIGGVTATLNGGDLEIASDLNFTITESTSGTGTGNAYTFAGSATDSVAGSFDVDTDVNTTLTEIREAMNTLRSQASTFGTNLSVVENRQSFTKAMVNTLETGAGLLTLADTNEEGANLLALQTRQQLSSTALSFASQADQNVLRLFG